MNARQILAETKDPRAVQPFLSKSFEGVKEIQFADPPAGYTSDQTLAPVMSASGSMASDDVTSSVESIEVVALGPSGGTSASITGSGDKALPVITAMRSAEGETVEFVGFVDPHKGNRRGNVEVWMLDVEDAMKSSVQDNLGRALKAYTEDSRGNWLLSWPGQVVLAADQVLWTHMTEQALRAPSAGGLSAVLATLSRQLGTIVSLVRGELSALQRITLAALITMQVHGRDVVCALQDKRVDSVDHFEWFAQMRCVVCLTLCCVCVATVTLARCACPGITGRVRVMQVHPP